MKLFLTFLILLFSISIFAQETQFELKGRVVDPLSNPVESAYIINGRTLTAYATNRKGEFKIPVQENDSLIINHLSFLMKKIRVGTNRKFLEVYLEYDTVQIPEITVSPGPDKDSAAVQKTLNLIKSADVIIYKRMNPEMNIVNQTMIENNSVLRAEASSLSIFSTSPSGLVKKAKKKVKQKKKARKFNFYRSEKQKKRAEQKRERRERRKSHK